MNILQIIANKGWGGGEKYVWELACKLTERGHNVYIVIPPCDILSKKFANYETYTQLFHGPFDFVAIHSLAKLIKKHQIKIVHTHLFKHTMAALLARYFYKLPIKVIMTRHLCKPAKKTLHYPWLYSKIDKLIFVSEYARKAFFSSHPNINNEKTIVIYNSTTYKDNVSHPNYRETLCINSDKFLIGFAGTICPEKGINFLIDLASKLKPMDPDIIFIIAGNTHENKQKYMHEILREINQKGLNEQFYFIGFIESIPAFFSQMNAVIIPTLIPESFGMVILEAMIAQRPIFFSEYISPEIITSYEGQPINSKDILQSCYQICNLKNNPTLQNTLVKRAYLKWSNNFTYDKFIKQIESTYNS